MSNHIGAPPMALYGSARNASRSIWHALDRSMHRDTPKKAAPEGTALDGSSVRLELMIHDEALTGSRGQESLAVDLVRDAAERPHLPAYALDQLRC